MSLRLILACWNVSKEIPGLNKFVILVAKLQPVETHTVGTGYMRKPTRLTRDAIRIRHFLNASSQTRCVRNNSIILDPSAVATSHPAIRHCANPRQMTAKKVNPVNRYATASQQRWPPCSSQHDFQYSVGIWGNAATLLAVVVIMRHSR